MSHAQRPPTPPCNLSGHILPFFAAQIFPGPIGWNSVALGHRVHFFQLAGPAAILRACTSHGMYVMLKQFARGVYSPCPLARGAYASIKVNNILHMQLPQNVGSSITECLPRVCVCIIYTVYVCPVCVCQPAASNELAPQDNCWRATRIVAAVDHCMYIVLQLYSSVHCTEAAEQCPLYRSIRCPLYRSSVDQTNFHRTNPSPLRNYNALRGSVAQLY